MKVSSSCLSLLLALSLGKERRRGCGPGGDSLLVGVLAASTEPIPPGRKSAASAEVNRYQGLDPPPLLQQRRQLLIGGETAPENRYPYYVSLQHYCGGALIAPDIVLTAGHCKPGRHDRVRVAVKRYIYPPLDDDGEEDAGSGHMTEGSRRDDPNVVYEEIVESHRHPDWSDPGDDDFVHDFSLLKLAPSRHRQDRYNAHRERRADRIVVRINRDPTVPLVGQVVRVLGAGDTVPGENSRSNILQQVDLQAVSNLDCDASYSVDRNLSYGGRIHPSHLCTGYGTNNTKDACDYDSGSPIVVVNNDRKWTVGGAEAGGGAGGGALPTRNEGNHHNDLLVGLVSWGEDCADPDFPGKYGREYIVFPM
jgi:Trypsin